MRRDLRVDSVRLRLSVIRLAPSVPTVRPAHPYRRHVLRGRTTLRGVSVRSQSVWTVLRGLIAVRLSKVGKYVLHRHKVELHCDTEAFLFRLLQGLFNMSTPSGACSSGFYCSSGSSLANPLSMNVSVYTGRAGGGGVCPVGFYCPRGTAVPYPCPAGTYNNVKEQSQCQTCPSGYFCKLKC